MITFLIFSSLSTVVCFQFDNNTSYTFMFRFRKNSHTKESCKVLLTYNVFNI